MSEVTEATENAVDQVKEKASGNGGGSRAGKLLLPAAAAAGTLVTGYAAKKVPELFREHVQPRLEEKGEDQAQQLGKKAAEGAQKAVAEKGGIAGKVLSKVVGGGGGGGKGGKKTRRLPIQRWTDVAVPVSKAYQAWIDFDQYPKFMHRVVSVQHEDGEDTVRWQEKIWFSKRQWEGRITEQRRNDRIVWTTESGMSHKGIVSFHKLDDRLTRVMVEMEFEPNGMIEKMASGLRFVKRAVQADLARFKAFVEMEDAEGIEYRAVKEKDRKKDDEKDEDGGEDNEGGEDSPRASQNGDDEDAEASRQEREKRRKERQKSLSS